MDFEDASGSSHEEHETLRRDLTCIECQYNLRGLNQNGRCPECGRTIADSLRIDLLRFADAAWLAKIIRGWSILYVLVLSAVIGWLTFIVGGLMFLLVMPSEFGLSGVIIACAALLIIAAICLYPGACWLVGTPESLEHGKRDRAATIVRWSGIGLMPAVFLWFTCRYSSTLNGWPVASELLSHFGFGVLWLHIFSMNAAHLALSKRVESGARNMDVSLRRARGCVRNLPVLILIAHWGIGLWMRAAGNTPGPTPSVFDGLGRGPGGILMILLWISVAESGRPLVKAMRRERDVSHLVNGDSDTRDTHE